MPNEVEQLLTEIRDIQRDHLAEYRRIAERQIALQEQAAARSKKMGRLYRIVVIASAIVVTYFIWRVSH